MRKKTEEKRQSIIDAAFVVFRESGFAEASMAEIAARSGASKATLYSYFTSKEELFAEVMTNSAANEIRDAFGHLRLDIPLRESLISFGRQYLPAVLSPSILAIRRLSFQEGERSTLGQALYDAGPKRGWAIVSEFLARAIAAGSVRACDPGVAARHLQALYEAELVELATLGFAVKATPTHISAVVTRAVDVFLAGYGTHASEH